MKIRDLFLVLAFSLVLTTSFANIEITDINSAFFVKSGDLVKTRVFLGNWGELSEQVYTVLQVTGRNYFHEYKTSPNLVKVGTESTISVYFKAPTQEGDYKLRVKAYNQAGSFEREYRFKVLSEWKDFEVVLCSEEPVLEKNEASRVFLCLANTGTEAEDYTVTISDWANYKLEMNSYKLSPSQETSIPIMIYTDLTKTAGDYSVSVSVKAVRSGIEKQVVIPLSIIGTDKERTDFNTNITAVSSITGDLITMNLTIVNRGQANLYLVDVDYPEDWTGRKIEQTRVFLKAGEEKVVTLNFLPKSEGVYPIKLIVSTDEGEIFLKEFRITSFGEGKGVGLTGAFLRVTSGSAPAYIFLVLIILGATFLAITYFLNSEGYYVYPKRKDKDINLELQ